MKHFFAPVILLVLLQVPAFTQHKNLITLQSEKSEVTISRHIYGHFAEHLGRCIYGGFYVGEKNARVPHTDGVRNDVIQALKKLKVPNLRWPGGCFADTYHWKDGIGEKSKRPSLVNVWWGGVSEDNSFGTHDFLNMCERIGAEPYLSANVGSGTVAEVADWVQYVNFNGLSPMSSLRKTNGRSEPWNVKYWGVGNEAWGCGGNMKPEYYANIYRQYATFMTDWGNSSKIFRIASGANSSDYNWTEVLMRDIPLHMLEGVALHHYSVTDWNKKGPSTNFSDEQYFGSLKVALRMEELVTRHSAIMDKYDPQKKVALVVDEWGGWYDVIPGTNPGFLNQQNTMRDAMIAGVTLNIFNNHADRVRMANLAQTINVLQAVILTDEERMLLTPTYHVMEMFNVHQDATLIPLTISNSDFVFQDDKLPALSASASVDSLGNTHISVVNIDATKTHDVTIQAPKKFTSVSARILTAQKISDHNTFDSPEKVAPKKFNDFQIRSESVTVKIPPFSVLVLQLK